MIVPFPVMPPQERSAIADTGANAFTESAATLREVSPD
jgi:hypothetical protein